MANETPNPDEKPSSESPPPSDVWARQPQRPAEGQPSGVNGAETTSEPTSAVPTPIASESDTGASTPEAATVAAAPLAGTVLPQIAPGVQSDPSSVAVGDEPAAAATPAATASRQRPGLPKWLPAVLLALIPAALVGIVVYIVAGSGGGNNGESARIVDGLIRLGGTEGTTTTYAGKLPPEFTSDFPLYKNADVIVSIAIASDQGTSYFIVLASDDPASKIYEYYSGALDADPWQVEIGRSSDDFTGIRFSRPDSADISADMTLYQSEVDNKTAIYLSYQDTSQAVLPGATTSPFAIGPSRPLPAGFPKDIPIYQGDADSTVLDTYFERGQGSQAYIVTFITRDTQDDVIDFYTNEFKNRGWNVTDAGVLNTSFALSIQFDDGNAKSISGSVSADAFDQDNNYTRVDLLLQVSPTRRGN
ncbi:MAG TPA: hypothetical protein VFX19_12565 [Dehalococcoidia bacterium]|nr:hypothetical protein [Dehalococcoidia bacterium]